MDDWNNKGRFCGGSFDGQYHKLNVPRHLADKLSLDIEFTETAVTWDIAHRLELSFDDTEKANELAAGIRYDSAVHHEKIHFRDASYSTS